ncbi:MAG: hypothetical protein OXC06_06515, partial [Acidimicrobiaceae bacterium]|nr:hypothetical protein [Acidimicrobiaceae bacterium]
MKPKIPTTTASNPPDKPALNAAGITLIRPATKTEQPRPAQRFLRPLRQIIESVNQTLKAQLSLERHAGRTRCGVAARI